MLCVPQALLESFVPFLVESGYEDADFILSLNPDEWDVMLEGMVADAKTHGVDIKLGHKMQFKKRLRDMQVWHARTMHAI